MLYSIYSFPNFILPLFGGIIIDKLGVRLGVFTFSLILVLGQGVVAISGYYRSYVLMLVGRVIFALGGENLSIT